MGHEPHESHIFDEWESDILNLPDMSAARFAMIRRCGACGGEDAKAGGAGSRWQDSELEYQCTGV